MTEGPILQNEKPGFPVIPTVAVRDAREALRIGHRNVDLMAYDMCVRVWLEVGHSCSPRPRSSLGHSLLLDWCVWVRGVAGHDISAFVHKVVFHLRPADAFVYPNRVIQEPPYEVQESGCNSIDIPIHVYLKHTDRPKRIKLRYSLHIDNVLNSSSEVNCVYYDVENPSELLKNSLMKGGGEIIARTGSLMNGTRNNTLVVITDDKKSHRHLNHTKTKKYKVLEPIQWARPPKKSGKSDICPKCGDPTSLDFKNLLKSVAMTDSEIDTVSQLYVSYSNYEKSANAIVLPPFSDPIYRIPELPLSLRKCLANSQEHSVKNNGS